MQGTNGRLDVADPSDPIRSLRIPSQVIDGRLYVTDLRSIFFDRHYAMARIMPLLLAMKRFKVG